MPPIPQHIPLQSPIRSFRVNFVNDYGWKVWLTANKSFTLGTFILLSDNDSITRITLHEDGTESHFIIKGDHND